MYEKKRPDLEINAAEKNKFWAEREVSMSVIFFSPLLRNVVKWLDTL